jgi:hypothetical protein
MKFAWRRIRVASAMFSPCRIEMPSCRASRDRGAEKDRDQGQDARVQRRDRYQATSSLQ